MSIYLKKPEILRDLYSKGSNSVFRKVKNSKKERFLNPFSQRLRGAFNILVIVAFFFLFFGFNFSIMAPTALSQISEEERRSLEVELEKIEEEIDHYEENISSLQSQRKTLGRSISLLNAEIRKLELQIRATEVQLQKLDGGIIVLKKDIKNTRGGIEKLRVLLSGSLRQIYSDDEWSIIEMILTSEKISDVFDNLNGLAIVQGEMRKNMEELVELNMNLVVQKDVLSTERSDVLNLREIKGRQKYQLDNKKKEKDYLIKITEGQESAYQELLKKSKQTAAQIRSRIFEFLGGGELTFGEAYKLAQFASEQTGVRAALILAVLDKESGLGRNVGRCNWETAMHPTRDKPVFLQIVSELGINPNSVSVSCPILSDGAYGGAMGPAQFIPSTWNLYKKRIGAITGNNPPSPWRNVDAFIATALYMKDMGADAGTYYAERAAAAKYYAGSRWKRYVYSYGEGVMTRVKRFQDDINSLNEG